MIGDFSVWLADASGARLLYLDSLLSFSASREVGGIGRFNGLLAATFDPSYIQRDFLIMVDYRGRHWRTYFLRRWRWERRQGERVLLFKGCPCCNELLMRRIVAGYAESAQGEMTDLADDMMKQVVTDSQSDVTLPVPDAGSRDWDDFTVAADLGKGPTLSLSFEWQRLLLPSGSGALNKIASAAKEAGTEVFFDLVPVLSADSIDFEFRTYTSQPGADVTDQFVFNEESGSLAGAYYEEDWTEEVNYVYAGGQGSGPARTIEQVYDATRYGASAWARREGFLDGADIADASLEDAGNALLQQRDGIVRAGGVPVDTDKILFGRDWYFGDKVRVRVRKSDVSNEYAEFDAIVWAAAIGVDGSGNEIREVKFTYES